MHNKIGQKLNNNQEEIQVKEDKIIPTFIIRKRRILSQHNNNLLMHFVTQIIRNHRKPQRKIQMIFDQVNKEEAVHLTFQSKSTNQIKRSKMKDRK